MIDETQVNDEDCGCAEYNALSRREFVGAAAATGVAAFFPAWLPKVVLSETHAGNRDPVSDGSGGLSRSNLKLLAPCRRIRLPTWRW